MPISARTNIIQIWPRTSSAPRSILSAPTISHDAAERAYAAATLFNNFIHYVRYRPLPGPIASQATPNALDLVEPSWHHVADAPGALIVPFTHAEKALEPLLENAGLSNPLARSAAGTSHVCSTR